MTARNDGGAADTPAFPVTAGQQVYATGMSLRDWFAGQALAGICAHEDTWGLQMRHIGPKAYEIADAMLAARPSATEGSDG